MTVVSRTRRHVSQINELWAKLDGSVIRVDWKIEKIAQNLATFRASRCEVGRQNITVLV